MWLVAAAINLTAALVWQLVSTGEKLEGDWLVDAPVAPVATRPLPQSQYDTNGLSLQRSMLLDSLVAQEGDNADRRERTAVARIK